MVFRSFCPVVTCRGVSGRPSAMPKLLSQTLTLASLLLSLFLLAASASAAEVTLAWDANTEADLEGYGVYFKKDAPGPPYGLFGYVATEELADPAGPVFTVTGLEKGGRYYFAVTAYDTEGNESYFSSSVCADVGETVVPCPSSTGGGESGGSGGGAGCFVETASAEASGATALFFVMAAVMAAVGAARSARGTR